RADPPPRRGTRHPRTRPPLRPARLRRAGGLPRRPRQAGDGRGCAVRGFARLLEPSQFPSSSPRTCFRVHLSTDRHSVASLVLQWVLLLALPAIWLYLVIRRKRKGREQ